MAYSKNFTILMAGGGTGGHLLPGISLAKAFQSKNRQTKIVFFVPGTPVDLAILSSTDFPFTLNPMRSFPSSFWKYPNFFCQFFFGWHKALHVFRKNRPDLVVGLGGYGSWSAGCLAKKYNLPLVMLEANKIAGKVVRKLAKDCKRVYTSGEIQGISEDKIKPLGIPIRFSRLQTEERQNIEKNSFTILVMGGSLGAKCINDSLVQALPFLNPWKHKIEFIHLCGKNKSLVEQEYKKNGMCHHVFSFCNNMEDLYLQSDLIISRAGGSTLSEITAMGMPSILVPFARSADGHQEANALSMAKSNASLVILEKELTGELLASKIKELILDKAKISEMSKAALNLAKPFAATDIVSDVYSLLGKTEKT
ncbi:MAG: UDP-N-acetylglucosamine--N-acetylmuramyl-(pentapeptide) pyrophosphoryl-undecaprenol N-acetylglucosamine transferase [Candidatus Brocadiae bacterium]|nr:UDP-N-acetylglucosamine--N-acetylmuramyl-(pentapeptide) pyrophosphoryl-undecaprenol N-acetylglucosamine transferase [Candidatus Brocadiia bacterium]